MTPLPGMIPAMDTPTAAALATARALTRARKAAALTSALTTRSDRGSLAAAADAAAFTLTELEEAARHIPGALDAAADLVADPAEQALADAAATITAAAWQIEAETLAEVPAAVLGFLYATLDTIDVLGDADEPALPVGELAAALDVTDLADRLAADPAHAAAALTMLAVIAAAVAVNARHPDVHPSDHLTAAAAAMVGELDGTDPQ